MTDVDANELFAKSAAELAALYRDRSVSPLDAVQSVLERIDSTGDPSNAVVTLVADHALDAAKSLTERLARGEKLPSPMAGIPITVKDTLATRGIRTTRGARLTRDWIPDFDAAGVRRLRDGGAIIVGKTNAPDGVWKGESGNLLFGPTTNPWDSSVTAGGSSGGASAAVAWGYGPVAVGTDGAGSLRIPPSFCGVVGFKPTFGTIPYFPLSPEQLSHLGPIARTVPDVAMAMSVLAGSDRRDPTSLDSDSEQFSAPLRPDVDRKRIGLLRSVDNYPVDQTVAAALDDFAGFLIGEGHDVFEIALPEGGYEIVRTLTAAFVYAEYEHYSQVQLADLDPGLQQLIGWSAQITTSDLVRAQTDRLTYWTQVYDLMSGLDFIVSPTVATQPFEPGQHAPAGLLEDISLWLSWASFTYPWNIFGAPAINLPWTRDPAGVPIGMQVVGRMKRDMNLLAFARHIEVQRPWSTGYQSLTAPAIPHTAGGIDHPG